MAASAGSGGGILLTFDQDAALEPRSRAREGDQMRGVDRAPADLGGFDEQNLALRRTTSMLKGLRFAACQM